MKTIPFVKDIHAKSVTGKPMYQSGQPGMATFTPNDAPIMYVQLDFLLECTADPKFVDGLKPFEGQMLIHKTRESLCEQALLAPTRPGWLVEDDTSRRFTNVAMEPSTPLDALAFNYFTFRQAACDAVPTKGEAALANGGITLTS